MAMEMQPGELLIFWRINKLLFIKSYLDKKYEQKTAYKIH